MVDDTSQLTQSYIYILLIGAIEPRNFMPLLRIIKVFLFLVWFGFSLLTFFYINHSQLKRIHGPNTNFTGFVTLPHKRNTGF